MRGTWGVFAAGYVVVSSWLALTIWLLRVPDSPPPWAFFLEVWRASWLADLLFVGGSALGFFLGVHLARRSILASLLGAFAASYATYSLALLALSYSDYSPAMELRSQPEAIFLLPVIFGAPGLLFATVAPVVLVRAKLV